MLFRLNQRRTAILKSKCNQLYSFCGSSSGNCKNTCDRVIGTSIVLVAAVKPSTAFFLKNCLFKIWTWIWTFCSSSHSAFHFEPDYSLLYIVTCTSILGFGTEWNKKWVLIGVEIIRPYLWGPSRRTRQALFMY